MKHWLTIVMIFAFAVPVDAARVKDIARLQSDRDNMLTGYGLVVGLANTGDTEQALFTVQSIAAMLSRMGVRIDHKRLRTRNVAAVMVTTRLPSFATSGARIDVVVSAMGNARSLVGGTLLLTPLKAVDGKVYAIAQGSLAVGGYSAGASGTRVTKNHPNVGRIPGGAIVERGVAPKMNGRKSLTYVLARADFTTASNLAKAIASAGVEARAVDGRRIEVTIPENMRDNVVSLVAKIEAVEVETDVVARVVVNARTGTVVMGSKVRISPVGVAHGSLTVEITTSPVVSQPGALSGGETVVTPESRVSAIERRSGLRIVDGGASLEDLVRALNALGATPRDLIDILQAIRAAGAMNAEIEIQ
jgi:flagellar P-ring protein precursor FlgI